MIRAAIPVIVLSMISCDAAENDASTALWSIGNPTDEEQYYLELINRARADPPLEGIRLAGTSDQNVKNNYTGFGVNLLTMQSEFAVLPSRPPLAMNAKLIQSARAHSMDEFVNTFQDHRGSDGRYIGDRLTLAGYAFSNYGENTYTHAPYAWFGHASFQQKTCVAGVEWGVTFWFAPRAACAI